MEINMKYFLVFILFTFLTSILNSQNNSDPYIGKSLIKIHSSNNDIIQSLLELNVQPIDCRGSILSSNLIVDSLTISFLNNHHIPFSMIYNSMDSIIDLEMEYIQKIKKKTSANWYTVYRDWEEIESHIEMLVSNSDIVNQIVIGQSYEGRNISVIKITSDNLGGKPAVFINGCQHAREWITPMAATYLIETLSQQYYLDPEIQILLNEVDIYILPVLNPDGYVYTWEEDRWWRKNRQVNTGSDCVGIDLNRNWAFDWNGGQSTSNDPCSFIYVGNAPFSALETNLVSQYISSIPNLVSHIDIHNYSALIVGPWSSSDETTIDNEEISCLGTKMQYSVSNTNNYPYIFGTGSVNDLLYFISGGMVDWMYGSLGCLSFLYELRPANLAYFDSNFDGLNAFDNDENEIFSTCQEFYNGVLEMIDWAYTENCELPTGCSDPQAENYYCNTLEGNMGCLYNVDFNNPPQSNGAYNLLVSGLPVGFIDDGSCIYLNSIDSHHNNNKKVVKEIDFLGREITTKDFFIAIYNDGSVEKKQIIY